MNLPRTVFAAALAALATGCYTTPPKIYETLKASPELFAKSPVDIAILPVEDAAPYSAASEVCGFVRDALGVELIQRGYTPLSNPKVDGVLVSEGSVKPEVSVVDAGWLKKLSGKFGEDAALAMRITTWDASSLMSTGWVRFGADVALVAPGVEAPLWSGNIQGELKAGGDGPAPTGRYRRQVSVAKELAEQTLRFLPERRP